jgi:hypothetical protein
VAVRRHGWRAGPVTAGPRLGDPAAHRHSQQEAEATEAWHLAAYSTVNGLVAADLLATAGSFWYQLVADLAVTVLHAGLAGCPSQQAPSS